MSWSRRAIWSSNPATARDTTSWRPGRNTLILQRKRQYLNFALTNGLQRKGNRNERRFCSFMNMHKTTSWVFYGFKFLFDKTYDFKGFFRCGSRFVAKLVSYESNLCKKSKDFFLE
jgi:hypothetical protein